jgi:tetratricopeptide (TPR) repeat protein
LTTAPEVPQPASFEVREQIVLQINSPVAFLGVGSIAVSGEPPPLLKLLKPEGVESAFIARKQNETVVENVAAGREAAPAAAQPKIEPRVEPKTEPKMALATTPPTAENRAAINLKQAYDLYLLGRGRFEAGDNAGAIDSYLQSLKLEPGSAEVQLSLGHAYLKLQKDRDAAKAFKDSVKLNPNVAEAHYGLGFVSFRLGRFRDAADAFKKATTVDKRMAKAHYGLALAYQELGMHDSLLEEYRVLETLDKGLAKKLVVTFPQFNFTCRMVRGCP